MEQLKVREFINGRMDLSKDQKPYVLHSLGKHFWPSEELLSAAIRVLKAHGIPRKEHKFEGKKKWKH